MELNVIDLCFYHNLSTTQQDLLHSDYVSVRLALSKSVPAHLWPDNSIGNVNGSPKTLGFIQIVGKVI